MCLLEFVEFREILESQPIVGYREWRISIEKPNYLLSASQGYIWPVVSDRHELRDKFGIHAYNDYRHLHFCNCLKYYNNFQYFDHYYGFYYVAGIINQFGRVAIHKTGNRSEYARIVLLFTIKESGPKSTLKRIEKFNEVVVSLAKKYDCKTMHWQDWLWQTRRPSRKPRRKLSRKELLTV